MEKNIDTSKPILDYDDTLNILYQGYLTIKKYDIKTDRDYPYQIGLVNDEIKVAFKEMLRRVLLKKKISSAILQKLLHERKFEDYMEKVNMIFETSYDLEAKYQIPLAFIFGNEDIHQSVKIQLLPGIERESPGLKYRADTVVVKRMIMFTFLNTN